MTPFRPSDSIQISVWRIASSMAPRSLLVVLLASRIALPAAEALSAACSIGAFDEDEAVSTLSLLQVHSEPTRRSRSPGASAVEQVSLESKTAADASTQASQALSSVQSSLASLSALNDPADDAAEPDQQALVPADVDDLVKDIDQRIDVAARLLKDVMRHWASIPGLATAPTTASAGTPRASLERLGAQESWQPNANDDPRSSWRKNDEKQDLPERYSRLQPENRGAPQNPESYEALGSDAADDEKSDEVEETEGDDSESDEESEGDDSELDEVEETKGDDEPAAEGGLFAPSKTQERSHSGHKHKHGGKKEAAEAKSKRAADIKDAFDLFDADGSSAVDLRELKAALKLLGFAPEYGQPHKMMVDIDTDHNALIDYPEFLKMMLDHHLLIPS